MSDAEKVRIYFERASDLFNSIYTGEKSAFGRLTDKLLRPDLKERFLLTLREIQKEKPESVLDVGVGPGQYIKAYVGLQVPEIFGLDFSQPMLNLASKLVGEDTGASKVSYIVSEFMDYKFERKFDISVAMGVLDYIEDQVAFLRKMREISNKCAIVSFPSISIWRTPIRKARYFIKRCPVHFYTPDMILRFSHEAGFKSYKLIKIWGSGMDYWVRFDV